MLSIYTLSTKLNDVFPLYPHTGNSLAHSLISGNLHLPIGSILSSSDSNFFQVVDHIQALIGEHTYTIPLLKSLCDTAHDSLHFTVKHKPYSLACVTLSDKGYVGQREDKSGEIIVDCIQSALPLSFTKRYLLPDNPQRLKALVLNLALEQQFDLIITTGGTGIAPTDLTPEALLPLLTRRFPGFEQAMMSASFAKTPNALISRAFVGTIEQSFIIALQGSPKAVKENLEAVLPALPHTLEKLHGSTKDCAQV